MKTSKSNAQNKYITEPIKVMPNGDVHANLTMTLNYINWTGGAMPVRLIPMLHRSDTRGLDRKKLESDITELLASVSEAGEISAIEMTYLAELTDSLTSFPDTPDYVRTLCLAGVGSLQVKGTKKNEK